MPCLKYVEEWHTKHRNEPSNLAQKTAAILRILRSRERKDWLRLAANRL